ncbi:MAG: N-acetyl-gamma-glutamyl-phosphate reductase [Deltaproteobacteria bacterium]|nr:N-acetyl-gamma-glutamyl-phosphate reductase [Deltaproteobacteria bacterium]
MTRVAIFGATGYTGFELIRLLLSHPGARIAALSSEQYSGQPLAQVFSPFKGNLPADVAFGRMEQVMDADFDAAFLALPHTVSAPVAAGLLGKGIPVIDLSADFRFRSIPLYESVYGVTHRHPALSARAVYGLPEVYRRELGRTRLAAVPGCFPTSVILALYPLLKEGLVDRKGIVADCKTGVSGGGRSPSLGFHYPEVEGGVRPYGLPRHRHSPEMDQELSLAAGEKVQVTFVPHLVPMVRGILATCYATARPKAKTREIEAAYRAHYGKEPFVRLCPPGALPATKDVQGSNFCDVAFRLDEKSRRLIAVSAIDNLVKGASGAAVQCFNLMMGFPEEDGLRGASLVP